jgi:RNA polymerase sigma-70 factor (ECF subfamily)
MAISTDSASLATVSRLLEETYATDIRRLISVATALTGDAAAGEDLAHDTFVQLAKRLGQDPQYLNGPAWPLLRKVLVRLALQRRRTASREWRRLLRAWQPSAESLWEPDPSFIDWQSALRALPPRMRMTVILFYGEDLSTADVAAHLSCSHRTVENQLRLARQRLSAWRDRSEEDSHD